MAFQFLPMIAKAGAMAAKGGKVAAKAGKAAKTGMDAVGHGLNFTRMLGQGQGGQVQSGQMGGGALPNPVAMQAPSFTGFMGGGRPQTNLAYDDIMAQLRREQGLNRGGVSKMTAINPPLVDARMRGLI